MYGYRFDTCKLPLPTQTKNSVRIKHFHPLPQSSSTLESISVGPNIYGAAYPKADHKDFRNTLACIVKRIGAVTPNISMLRKEQIRNYTRKFMAANFNPIESSNPISFTDWITNAPYEQYRKEELIKVHAELERTGLLPRDFEVDAFIKEESYPEYKCARGIYSRSDKFKCYVGPLIKLMQDILFKHPSFIKTVPVSDRPRYVKEYFNTEEGNIYSGDFTAYESHFTSEMMEMIEFEVYDYLCSQNEKAQEINELFKKVISGTNVIKFADATVTVDATRMSGEMNTSLGNGIVNLIIINFICEELYNSSVKAVVEGDDSLYKTEADLKTQDYVDCGFTCKLEKHECINTASFCGLIFDEDSEVVIADPIKYILKTPWINRRWLNSSMETKLALYKSRALSLLWQFPGCPIINSYAKYLYRMTVNYKIRPSILNEYKWNQEMLSVMKLAVYDEQTLYSKMPKKEVTFGTRMIMEQVFDIPIGDQLYMEKFFDDKNDLDPIFDEVICSYTTQDQRDFYSKHVCEGNLKYSDAKDFIINTYPSNSESQKLYDLLLTTQTSRNNLARIKLSLNL